MNNKYRKLLDEPTMSDKTLLVSVEDLISAAFGSTATNVVNFKVIQLILHILARQLRLLEQQVEIKLDDIEIPQQPKATSSRAVIVGNIELVTCSQFALLEASVNKLAMIAGPLPTPTMPDNAQLRKDLAKGRASLSDTMQVMQLNARVLAAEQGLQRLAELLTQLASAGLLPPEVTGNINKMRTELQQAAIEARVDEKTGRAGDPDRRTGDPDRRTGDSDRRTGDPDRRTGDPDRRSGDPDRRTGDPDRRTGDPDRRTGEHDRRTGDPDSRTGDPDRRTGDSDRRTGDPDRRTGDPDRRTGDPDRRTDDYDRRTGDPDGRNIDSKKGGKALTAVSTMQTSPTSAYQPTYSSAQGPGPGHERSAAVTFHELEQAIAAERGDINKEIQNLIGRANNSADSAYSLSKQVADKLEIVQKMDKRLTSLYSQTADYTNQLRGFDNGLTTQMASFQEQMGLLKNDLGVGLKLFDAANNSAETAAILDLNERCEGVAIELESTVHQHQCLTLMQQQLSDELRNVVECLEMLREQKADRDEVNDGLRDKADNTRLVGLLQETDFAEARVELLQEIGKSYDKFHKQEAVWHRALEDLLHAAEVKAPIVVVVALKKAVEQDVNAIQKKIQQLEIMLGEPKAAILMRQLAANAACATCLTRALMEPSEHTHGKPFPLPPLHPATPPSPPCSTLAPVDTRKHICNRWVGGSHTLLASSVPREKAHVSYQPTIPKKKYEGFGNDGRLYLMEEDYQPCEECNKWSTDHPGIVSPQTPIIIDGGGDQVLAEAMIKEEGNEKETDKTVCWEQNTC